MRDAGFIANNGEDDNHQTNCFGFLKRQEGVRHVFVALLFNNNPECETEQTSVTTTTRTGARSDLAIGEATERQRLW